ncbi:MAG: hypothetical protein AB7G28_20255 [Pirellulales bacterium]
MPRPRFSFRSLKYGRAYLLGLIAVVCLGWALYSAVHTLVPPQSVELRLAAGSAVTRRFQIAETFANEARHHDVFIDVAATGGFEDSIHQLADGTADLAIVSTGLETAECKEGRILAGLDVAPLHILVRRQYVDSTASLAQMVRGRTVNVGEPGTNDYLVATDILHLLRLRPGDDDGRGDYTQTMLTKDELARRAKQACALDGEEREARLRELPDVVMTVGTLPGLSVQDLLDTGEYELVPFSNLESYLLSDLQCDVGPDGDLDRVFLEPTTIRRGMYLGSSVNPASDCPTIGLRTLLVARATLPDATVKRLMQCVFDTDFTRRIHPTSPRELATPYKIHPAAVAYLDRDKPLLTGTFFETISTGFSVFGAFSAGALSLYGYLRRRRVRRPGEYLEEIRKIDLLASGQQVEGSSSLPPAKLAQQLDVRLTQLKEQIIQDYCSNRVQGEMTLLSILSILSDTRTQLRVSPGRHADTKSSQVHAAWRGQNADGAREAEQGSGRAA